ncbi:glutathionylspermidine synthase family protein [Cytobacillus sp. IB215665]|uniref:glutathionylspermidine synthase family protein n=1 Tax=Cytobacillus sp. IB215665 TaxID=3097357 RepID=UPI002A1742CF|nr:glutathionylspermidine synthase family protein [Cytobacillus sp. IB215665]MDX8363610.1 glutathionylspermidine synthase family protein [Cytobacillus sp. IB215665]
MKEWEIRRREFYDRIPKFWPDMYGQEYALFDIHPLTMDEVENIRLATSHIGSIFFKIARLLRHVNNETLQQLGFPNQSIPYLRLQTIDVETIIARLDLVKVGSTYKVLEFNADTPTFIKELFSINGKVCDTFGYQNPNQHEEEQLANSVRQAIFSSIKYVQEISNPYVVFTSHEESDEDLNTSLYLQDLANIPSRFVPLHKLQIKKSEGLYDENGRKIDVLYRQTYPLEHLVCDKDEFNNNIGVMLLDLVRDQKLAIINPPSAFLLQSKAILAAIWGLHEDMSDFFSKIEHDRISKYFLPTYLEADPLIANGLNYVKKPSFGREGDTVEIFSSKGEKILEDKNKSYTSSLPVYQQLVELPTTSFQTVNGMKEGHIIIGSFLLQGRASAIGYRVGNKITDNLSYYLPIGIKR